jgi:hypothetical protein
VANSRCVNTEGSFYCGECERGFAGNQSLGCHDRPGMCPDGSFCDENAECVRLTGLSYYVCKVCLAKRPTTEKSKPVSLIYDIQRLNVGLSPLVR